MKLNCKVERIFYPREGETGAWHILGTSEGKATGEMDWRPKIGDRLQLLGEWGQHQGERQFKFKSAAQDLPISKYDQLLYVCEKTKGVGSSMREKIYKIYGDDWEEIEREDVPGMGEKMYSDFIDQVMEFEREKEKAEAIAFLMSKGCTMQMASAAWKLWERSTKEVVYSNCYRLTELPNYGFIHVDRSIRHSFEIGDTDPRRITAAIVYAMQQLTSSGSTVINWYVLRDEVFRHTGGEGLSITVQMISDHVREMFEAMTLHSFPESMLISLEKHYEYESAIWDYVK